MIGSIAKIAKELEHYHQEDKTIALTTGFFDLIHPEHIAFLKKSKLIADILVVGVESDARARAIKGRGRPIESQGVRCTKVESIEEVDYVIALPDRFNSSADHELLVRSIRPKYFTVSRHTPHQEEKRLIVKKYDGELKVVHAHNPAISTTQKIKDNQAL